MKYLLAPYVRVGIQGETLFFGFGSIQKKVVEPELQNTVLKAASIWKTPHAVEEVLEKLLKDSGINENIASQAIQIIIDGHFLIQDNSYIREERYSRHNLYYALSGGNPFEIQDSLKDKHVIVLGCGGIGNAVSVSLVTAGIGKITLADCDDIEISNLTRQFLFTEKDIGKNKIEVLKKQLELRNHDAIIETKELIIKKPQDLYLLPSADLIVVSADKPRALSSWVNRYAVSTNTPFINVGYVQDIAVWGPLVIPGQTGCWDCQKVIADDYHQDNEVTNLIQTINKDYQAPSIGPINMMAASCALTDILRYLGGYGEIMSLNKRIGLWSHNMTFETQNCELNKDCQTCQH